MSESQTRVLMREMAMGAPIAMQHRSPRTARKLSHAKVPTNEQIESVRVQALKRA
jgi:hypothetical protein